MSYSSPDAMTALMKRAPEFDSTIKDQITDQIFRRAYEKAMEYKRFDLDTVNRVPMLSWEKNEDPAFIHSFQGEMTMSDIRCMAQFIEEDYSVGLDHMTQEALQYSTVRVVESTRGISKANVGIFEVNTCELADPTIEGVNRGIDKIRQLIDEEGLDDVDVFEKDFLIFPIYRFGQATCIVILNPNALLASSEGSDRGMCKWVEIKTSSNGNSDIKDHIGHILDNYRNHHARGPFLAGMPIQYDEEKHVVIPRLPGKYYQQFQLLYIVRKVLENHANLKKYIDGDLKNIGKDVYAMMLEIKQIRLRILGEIAYDIHKDGTDLQRYLYEKRIKEVWDQEQDRKKKVMDGIKTSEEIRENWNLAYPSICALPPPTVALKEWIDPVAP